MKHVLDVFVNFTDTLSEGASNLTYRGKIITYDSIFFFFQFVRYKRFQRVIFKGANGSLALGIMEQWLKV